MKIINFKASEYLTNNKIRETYLNIIEKEFPSLLAIAKDDIACSLV